MANNRHNTLEAMTFTPEQEEKFLNPAPGTAAARARDFGIDLTLTLACLRMTPQERLELLEAKRELVYSLRQGMQKRKGQHEEA